MVISPYYFNLSDRAVEKFYDSLADRVHGPVLLYNFPARTGYDLKPEVILGLARRHKNIVGIKDTVGTMGHTREIIQTVKSEFPEFLVYSGFDEFFAHNVLSGGDGCIAGFPTLRRRWLRDLQRRQEIMVWRLCRHISRK